LRQVIHFASVRRFGETQRYRGLDKNPNRLFVTCALVNLFMVRTYADGYRVVLPIQATRPDPGRSGTRFFLVDETQRRERHFSSELARTPCSISVSYERKNRQPANSRLPVP
jgi:hypothetical protein